MNHREYGIDVKSMGGYRDDPGAYDRIGEQEADWLWQAYTTRFWSDADQIARTFGLDSVWQEGRSGGWLVGYLNDQPATLQASFVREIEALQAATEADLLQAIRDRAAEIERIERTNALAEAGWRS